MPLPPIVLAIDLEDYLILSGKGRPGNLSNICPPGQIINGTIPGASNGQAAGAAVGESDIPAGGQVWLYGVQFDGVYSGQVTFQFDGAGQIAGFAVQNIIQDERLLSSPGRPLRYTVNNQSSQTVLFNFDYLTIERTVIRELLASGFSVGSAR